MSAFSGSLLLIKIYDSVKSEFITLGGLKTTKISLNNNLIDSTHKLSGAWREILPQSGIKSISISGNGIFTGSDSEKKLREIAFHNKIEKFLIQFGNGEKIIGNFMITSYDRIGNYNDEENYHVTLESSGKIDF